MFTEELFTIAKTWKQPKCPSIDDWFKKMWHTRARTHTHTHTHTHTLEYRSAMKEKEILPFAATWMEVENIIVSEVYQTKKRQISYDITYMWNLKI